MGNVFTCAAGYWIKNVMLYGRERHPEKAPNELKFKFRLILCFGYFCAQCILIGLNFYYGHAIGHWLLKSAEKYMVLNIEDPTE